MPPSSMPKSEIQRLIEEEARRHGLNPALLVAIATQESWLNPHAVGDNGRSLGLFQLQRAAAQDAGIDPNRRGELGENIRGGVTYFKQQLRKEGGNVERALSRYNRGTPTYRGIGDPNYVENVLSKVDGGATRVQMPRAAAPTGPTRSLASRVTGMLSPRSAQAAEPSYEQVQRLVRGGGGGTVEPAPVLPYGAGPGSAAGAGPAATAGAGAEPAYDQLQAIVRGGAAPPPTVPQAPQAHPAVGRSVDLLGRLGVIPTVQMQGPHPPTVAEIAQQRGQEALQTGLGANLGELAGQAMGSAIAPGPGTVAGGTIGAMGGQAVEDLIRGRPFDPVQIGLEGALSAAPEALEGVLRPVGRWLLRQTPGGQVLRFDQAAREARQMVQTVFQPQTRRQVGQAFDAVRASGVRLDIGDVIHEVRRQSPGKYAELLAEARLLDDRYKTGGRYATLLEGLRAPPPGQPRTVAWDIGDLQQLRSAIRDRLDELEPAEARQLMGDWQRAVDRSIDLGLARGRVPAGHNPELLQEARRQWGRLRAAEDMETIIEDRIRSSPNLETLRFSLNTFHDEVRRGRTELSRSVRRGLEQTPGALARYEQEMGHIARLYDVIEMPTTDVSGIRRHWFVAGMGQLLSTIMTTTAGREAFREAVINGRGQVSLNAVALAANMGRRELGLEPFQIPDEAGPSSTAAGPAARQDTPP